MPKRTAEAANSPLPELPERPAKKPKRHGYQFGSPISTEAENKFVREDSMPGLAESVATALHPYLSGKGMKMMERCAKAFTSFGDLHFKAGHKYTKWCLDYVVLKNYIRDPALFAIYKAAKTNLGCTKVNLLLYGPGAGILEHVDALPPKKVRFMTKGSGNGGKTVPLHFGNKNDVLFSLDGDDGTIHAVTSNVNSTGEYIYNNASWSCMLGVDRARHTLNSFFSSYSRGVCIRLAAAFDNHPKKSELRFESACRL